MGKDEAQDIPVKASILQTRGSSLASPHASIHPFKTSGPVPQLSINPHQGARNLVALL